jgi:CheY-like chemotaxis protein/HPt (histidine-containing phosphotransfer) domain-containing protein
MLEELLRSWGMRTETAAAAREALDLVRLPKFPVKSFDILLADLHLPEMDALVKELRVSSPGTKPILMLTSGDDARALGSQELGTGACLTKPVRRRELRAAIAERPEKPVRPAPGHGPGGRTLHILVAEDNAINQLVVRGILVQAGHSVEVVQNGAEVAPMLAAHPFDVVLMDIQMPLMDGFQATAAIREAEKHTGAHMPVIALTAHATPGYKEKCLAAGMDGYVVKPIRPNLLLEALAEWAVPSPAARPDVTKPPEPPAECQFDTDDLVERLMGNRELARRLAGAFVDAMPGQLAALAKAIADSDAQATRLAAHSIKGAAANVGCAAVRNLASRLEELGEGDRLARASELLRESTAAFEALKPAIQQFCSDKQAFPV